jgi:hypothetical protein
VDYEAQNGLGGGGGDNDANRAFFFVRIVAFVVVGASTSRLCAMMEGTATGWRNVFQFFCSDREDVGWDDLLFASFS